MYLPAFSCLLYVILNSTAEKATDGFDAIFRDGEKCPDQICVDLRIFLFIYEMRPI